MPTEAVLNQLSSRKVTESLMMQMLLKILMEALKEPVC